MFKFITQRSFFVNLLVIILLVIVILIAFFSSLEMITKHGNVVKVPNIVGKNIYDAGKILKASGLDIVVQDSIFYDSLPRLSIIKQSPEADAGVKPGRIVFITINRAQAPLLEVPDMRGYSITSARQLLQNFGFKTGVITYKPDLAKDVIKEQLYNGDPIVQGTRLAMGAVIDFVVGDGVGNRNVPVPDIVGMTYGEAMEYLQTMNISIGGVNPDPGVTDMNSTSIYKQSPEPATTNVDGTSAKNYLAPGDKITVWLKLQTPSVDANGANGAETPTAKPADHP
ncbi:MAG: PASTA domain-containing protein [Chitinophagaceae bacterium]|jgi:beta-lactam-binding protein with PASTA domain|nr:PASTA domain-containing protein [Chitinophagaceae bacterium]